MNIKQAIKKALCHSCIYFTVITALYALIAMLVNVEDDTVLLDAGRLLLFFLFSVLMAMANGIRVLTRIPGILRLLIHYAITLFAFFSCFMLPISPTSSQNLIGFAIFTILYAIIAAIVGVISARYRALSEQDKTYTNQFSKK